MTTKQEAGGNAGKVEGVQAEAQQRRAAFESKLGEGRERFLAHVIEHGLTCGRRTPEDFIRHFPPKDIMEGLADQPELRANILVIATGVRVKVARKKSAEACAVDLQIALDEEEVDAETVVTLFDPDDRVRYLDHRALWRYITEGAFWEASATKDAKAHAVAAEHAAYMIDRGLKDRLLTHRDVVDGITVTKLAERVPRPELAKMIEGALEAGRNKKPFVDQDLLDKAPTAALVEHIPLPWIWNGIIVPRIAQAHGFEQAKEGASGGEQTAEPAPKEGSKQAEKAASTEAASSAQASATDEGDLDLDVDEVLDELDDDEPTGVQDSVELPRPKSSRSSRKK